jgi:hypothetical protein
MKMAKASQKHIDRLRSWMQFNDELCKIDPENSNEWNGLKKDWEQYVYFTPIIKHCENNDGRFIWEYYMDYYQSNISYIHGRILTGFEVLLDNVCDPELDYLDYNKYLKQIFENQNAKP